MRAHRALCLLAALALLPLAAARADQRDPALPALFERLRLAPNAAAAEPLEAAIWLAWTRHADPVVEQLMANAALAMQAGDRAAAERALDQVVALAPDYAEGWNRRATFCFTVGRYEASLADIARVLALEPRHFGALAGEGLVMLALQQPEAAAEAFAAALAVHPHLAGARQNLEALQGVIGKDI